MRDKDRRASETCLVAPTLRLARAAARALRGRWQKPLEPATLTGFLRRQRLSEVILCPEGRDLERDLAFLHEAHDRALWGAPDEDLRVAIAGLRGGHVDPMAVRVRPPVSRGRRLALLLEGVVTLSRARRALTSDVRRWIVESPFAVRLTARERKRLAKAGVAWSALEPVRVAALVASPELARARSQWRTLLPPRTKVWILEPRRLKHKR